MAALPFAKRSRRASNASGLRGAAALLCGFALSCASLREPMRPVSTEPTTASDEGATERAALAQRDSDLVPIGTSPRRGPDSAVVTVVEFADFECPFCGRVEPTMRALLQRYGRDLRIVWKDAPLPFHTHAPLAAEAAREAFAQRGNDGFFAMRDLLFSNQAHLEFDDLVDYAERIGLDAARFRAALEQHAHAEAVRADAALANSLHVRGTPAFAINGTWITGARPEREFVAVIDAVLARARTITPRETAYEAMTRDPIPAPRPPERTYAVATNPHAPALGDPHAPVVIELFTDFECPFCARVQPAIETLLSERQGRVVIHHRDYPLAFHSHAQLAAEAAREVQAQLGDAAFFRFAAMLYAHQDALDRADLERYAAALQVDMARFRDALDRRSHAGEIHQDRLAADATHVRFGTPAFFVNGRYRAGAMPTEELIRMVDEATPR